ncbi:MAG: hypothetical protein F6K24_31020 [Okeania sp. SIO2D1]|nr:hypothetical protein [Okeania sp. SIO2D1]
MKGVIAFAGGSGLCCFIIAWLIGKQTRKRLIHLGLILITVINLMAFITAYSLTNYKSYGGFCFGIPRPINSRTTTDLGLEFVTQNIPINSNKWLETWLIPAASSKGTVILFPGQGYVKDKQLLAPIEIFHSLNYDTVLVDYQGVGGSSGSKTTIGAKKSERCSFSNDFCTTN